MANTQTSVPLFVANSVLTAAQQNISAATGVPVFSTTVTRDASFGGSNKVLAEGQLCYLESTDVVQYYSGAAWASVGATADWAAWTPTLTNMTLGNGTLTARYSQVGKTVFYNFTFILGSTSAIAAAPTFNWPVAPASLAAAKVSQICVWYFDASAAMYLGQADPRSRTTSVVGFTTSNGSVTAFGVDSAVNATAPFTWTTSDTIFISGTYEAA